MNTIFRGRLVYLFLVVLLVVMWGSPVIAKVDCEIRPNHPTCPNTDPEPDPDPTEDSCLTNTSPFPEFMFWRKLNSANDSNWGIFLSSEDGVCVRQLFEIPDSSAAWMWDSSFSYDRAENRGFITWIRRGTYENPEEDSIWLLEFWAQGNTITAQSEPELIVMLPDIDPTKAEAHLPDLDVSKDLQNLVFTCDQSPNDRELHLTQVYVFDIEACRNSPCMPGVDSLAPHSGYNLGKVAWGPFGERFYVTEIEDGQDEFRLPIRIQMVTNVEGNWISRVLFSLNDYQEYDGIWRLSSGIIGDREKLAFRHDGDCRTVSVIDVDLCEEGSTCAAESQTFGVYPAWTNRGTIIYKNIERGRYIKRTDSYLCNTSDIISEWDPDTLYKTPLVEGEDPDTR